MYVCMYLFSYLPAYLFISIMLPYPIITVSIPSERWDKGRRNAPSPYLLAEIYEISAAQSRQPARIKLARHCQGGKGKWKMLSVV